MSRRSFSVSALTLSLWFCTRHTSALAATTVYVMYTIGSRYDSMKKYILVFEATCFVHYAKSCIPTEYDIKYGPVSRIKSQNYHMYITSASNIPLADNEVLHQQPHQFQGQKSAHFETLVILNIVMKYMLERGKWARRFWNTLYNFKLYAYGKFLRCPGESRLVAWDSWLVTKLALPVARNFLAVTRACALVVWMAECSYLKAFTICSL